MVIGNPTAAASEEGGNENVTFNSAGQLNATGGVGAIDLNVVSGDLGGGGGCGGSSVVFDHSNLRVGDPPHGATWTTSSPGGLKTHDADSDLAQQVEKVKEKVKELEKKENDRADIEYFKRNLHGALKVPENYLQSPSESPRLVVGLNDVLVINVDCSHVPPSKIEAFLRKAKKALCPLLDERGLKDRNLWVAGDRTGFQVIEIQASKKAPLLGDQDLAYLRRVHEAKGFADATSTFTPAKKRYPPPVMG